MLSALSPACETEEPPIRPAPAVSSPTLRAVPARAPRVVAIGGGTGLPALLGGLRALLYPARPGPGRPLAADRLTAIVTTTDDGGSSGTLRREYGIVPPGDIRNCLAALSDEHALLTDLFQYRFGGTNGLSGHALGNLMLAALVDVTHDFARAIEIAAGVVGAKGRVLPATREPVSLLAELRDGRMVTGETAIVAAAAPIRRLALTPALAEPLPIAIDAIRRADGVVVGPGSLYTSILPPLLVPGLARALAEAQGLRVLVLNLMTEPGETDGFGAADHLRIIVEHLGYCPFDAVLYNNAPIADGLRDEYATHGARPVVPAARDLARMAALGAEPIGAPLAAEQPAGKIRHQPESLARAVLSLTAPPATGSRRARPKGE